MPRGFFHWPDQSGNLESSWASAADAAINAVTIVITPIDFRYCMIVPSVAHAWVRSKWRTHGLFRGVRLLHERLMSLNSTPPLALHAGSVSMIETTTASGA